MALQDDLRAENLEVADTGTLLTQAADRIDVLEARVGELEGVLFQVRDLAQGALGVV